MSENVLSPEQYADRHKKAFRVAFDYLNAHFPPGDSTEWWEQTAKDAEYASIVISNRDPLATELLVSIYNYLEKEWKKRYGGKTDG